MREGIALIIFVVLASSTITLRVKKQLDNWITLAFLIFSIISPFLIVNYDFVKSIKYKDLEIETYKREVDKIKDAAIKDVKYEIEEEKKSLALVAENLTKMAYVISDGTGRWDGIPEPHMNKINEYKGALNAYLDPNLDVEINQTISQLNSQVDKTKKEIK